MSQFRALDCFVLADYVVGLVEIEFLLLAITSVASENLLGVALQIVYMAVLSGR